MTARRYLVDIMQDIVDNKISPALTPKLKEFEGVIEGVFYMYGHPVEIIQRLSAKDGTSFAYKKYPLVCLFTDVTEEKGDINYYSKVSFNLVVVHSTSPDFVAPDRLEKKFKPIIHPIVDELIKQIALSPYFNEFDPDLIERKEIDRYYWGKYVQQNARGDWFNDFLDATEINLTLTINQNCVLPQGAKNIH